MHPAIRRTAAAAGIGAGLLAVGRIAARRLGGGAAAPDRWHAVTVNRPPEQVAPGGRLPDPLAELGGAVEVRVRPAPGDRGTELAARVAGDCSVQRLRAALREARQLVETGELLSPQRPPTTRRTPAGLALGLVTRRAREEGRL